MNTTPVVFLPGLLCDAAVWAPQLPALGRSATVVEYGLPESLEQMAETAIAAAPAGRFALAGHSMGGRVAFEVWRRWPERVERLALLNTGTAPLAAGAAGETERAGRLALLDLARREGMRAMAAEWCKGMLPPAALGGPVQAEVEAMFGRRNPAVHEAQIQALMARPDAGPLLATITCPTLVLTGELDRWSTPASHEAIHRAIAGSRLVVVPGVAHMSTLEAPAAVNVALAGWLIA